MFASSTQDVPEVRPVPRHIAIIMDGNGRWAKKRFLPRVAGHKRGLEAVRDTIKACAEMGVEYLTLFAFSTENWRRPPEEVSTLMGLFGQYLEKVSALAGLIEMAQGVTLTSFIRQRCNAFDENQVCPKCAELIEIKNRSQAKKLPQPAIKLCTLCQKDQDDIALEAKRSKAAELEAASC